MKQLIGIVIIWWCLFFVNIVVAQQCCPGIQPSPIRQIVREGLIPNSYGVINPYLLTCDECPSNIKEGEILDDNGNGIISDDYLAPDCGGDAYSEYIMMREFFQRVLFRDVNTDRIKIEVVDYSINCSDCAWGYLYGFGGEPRDEASYGNVSDKALYNKLISESLRCYHDPYINECQIASCPSYPRSHDLKYPYDCCGRYFNKMLSRTESSAFHLLMTTGKLSDASTIGPNNQSVTLSSTYPIINDKKSINRYNPEHFLDLVKPLSPELKGKDQCQIDVVFSVEFTKEEYDKILYSSGNGGFNEIPCRWKHRLQLPYLFATEENPTQNNDRFGIFVKKISQGRDNIIIRPYCYPQNYPSVRIPPYLKDWTWFDYDRMTPEDIYSSVPDYSAPFHFSLPTNVLDSYLKPINVTEECMNYDYFSKYVPLCKNVPMTNGFPRKDAQGVLLEPGVFQMKLIIGDGGTTNDGPKDLMDSALMIGEAFVCSECSVIKPDCEADTKDVISVIENEATCQGQFRFQIFVKNQPGCTVSTTAKITYYDYFTSFTEIETNPVNNQILNGGTVYEYELQLPPNAQNYSKLFDNSLNIYFNYTCNGVENCFIFERPKPNFGFIHECCDFAIQTDVNCDANTVKLSVPFRQKCHRLSKYPLGTPQAEEEDEGVKLFGKFCENTLESICERIWYKKIGNNWVVLGQNLEELDMNAFAEGQNEIEYKVGLSCFNETSQTNCYTEYFGSALKPILPPQGTGKIQVIPHDRCSTIRTLVADFPAIPPVGPPTAYLWSTGATTPSIDVSNGTYSVTVTYASTQLESCSHTLSSSIAVPNNGGLVIPDLPHEVILSCSKECQEGIDLATLLNWNTTPVSGGIPPYKLRWSSDHGVTCWFHNCQRKSDTNGVFSVIPYPYLLPISKPGFYYFTVTDASGCLIESNRMQVRLENGIGFIDCVTCDSCQD